MKKDKSKPTEPIENKLTAYFDAAQQDSFQLDDKINFERDKVYANVLNVIGQKRKTNRYISIFKVAASILLFSTACLVIYMLRVEPATPNHQVAMVEKSVGRGKIVSLTLVDGTVVYLNAESKLTYPETFKGNTREVTLSGEAFFKVAHNKNKPFIIHTNKLTTQVLGTSFNISAYTNKMISVTVVTGKVSVYLKKKRKTKQQTKTLLPHHQILFDAGNDRISNPQWVDVNELVAWHERKILYKSRRLADVVDEIARSYDVTIKIPNHLKNCRITAELDNPSLEKLLKVLSQLVEGTYEFKNGAYLLSGKSC
ncbi:DUF4974 domain-containing protein [Pedobacter petrophilus]|uniref:DUF4974 domain-containing protein n=1 Tax=Pedobacter petrophilus TaxID=1908241 RepID=A0A7K0FYD9_9SPHI|nr:FecR family protein [Pedobacter petrophilus]MRX75736.1 DUF4974 domain-containing protein [Pedobacter petrophilus]